jgi:putative CRISPR-associated protein (TIGR02619 family)
MQTLTKPILHIVSVGVSVLRNLQKSQEFQKIPGSEGREVNEWLKNKMADRAFLDMAYQALRSAPWKISAELNSMRIFLEQGRVDEVYLIATDTEAGKFCSDLIHRFLKEEHRIEIMRGSGCLPNYYRIEKICGDKGPKIAAEQFSEGLHKLFNAVVRLIRDNRESKTIYINATGGFKPEIAVLSLAGNLFLVPVYYLHETFNEVVFLPPFIPPMLFPSEVALLKKIYDNNRRIAGEKFKKIWASSASVLRRLEGFKVVEIGDDGEGPYEVRLTPQGKFWVEISQKMEETDA